MPHKSHQHQSQGAWAGVQKHFPQTLCIANLQTLPAAAVLSDVLHAIEFMHACLCELCLWCVREHMFMVYCCHFTHTVLKGDCKLAVLPQIRSAMVSASSGCYSG
jgi:hypothetical protein